MLCEAEGRLARGDLVARLKELRKLGDQREAAGKSTKGKIVARPVEKSTEIAAA